MLALTTKTSICRICESAVDNLAVDLIDNKNYHFIDKLTNFANISYCMDDALPKFICLKCTQDLEFSIEFKNRCESTDQKLRNALRLIKNDPLNEVNIADNAASNIVYIKSEEMTNPLLIPNQSANYERDGAADIKQEIDESNLDDTYDRNGDSDSSTGSLQIKNSDTQIISKKPKSVIISRFGEAQSKEEENTNDFNCPICNKSYKTKRSLMLHNRSHNNVPSSNSYKVGSRMMIILTGNFECFICQKTYKGKSNLRKHITDVHCNIVIRCKICSKQFYNKTNLRRHVSDIHEQKKPFQCNICSRCFAQKSGLDEHIFVHKDEKTVQCDLCPYTTKTLRKLGFHMRNHNKSIAYKFKANRSRNNEMPATCTCEYCGKQSSTYNSHLIHIRTHTGEKPYHCDVCEKRFSQKGLLSMHIRVHTGELPYECKTCGRKFRQKSQLSGHMLTHTGDKPHKCAFCDKSFALRGNLTVHTRLHTGETPYHCTDCVMQFHSLNELKRHKKNQHSA